MAWVWVALLAARRSAAPHAAGDAREHVEGDDVRSPSSSSSCGAPRLPAAVDRRSSSAIGAARRATTAAASARPARLRARYVLERCRARPLPRSSGCEAVIEDPFGLERVEQRLDAPGALLVYPRLVELDRLFSESGTRSHDGRRLLLRRPSGFDLHSVRDFQQGESLRRVHWRSTAKRGQLMVKELEDSPRDEVAVVLDADAARAVGGAPTRASTSQVRAAGSILRAHARAAAARCSSSTQPRPSVACTRSTATGGARSSCSPPVEPTGTEPLATLLATRPGRRRARSSCVGRDRGARRRARRAPRRSARSQPRAGLGRLRRRRRASPARHATPRAEPAALLRLQRGGVPVAVVRAAATTSPRALGARRRSRRAAGPRLGRSSRRAPPRCSIDAANWLRLEEPRRRARWRRSLVVARSRSVRRSLAPLRSLRARVALARRVRRRRARSPSTSPLDAPRSGRDFFGPLWTARGLPRLLRRAACRSTRLDASRRCTASSCSRSSPSRSRVALAIAARAPVSRGARARRRGAGWPATLLPGEHDDRARRRRSSPRRSPAIVALLRRDLGRGRRAPAGARRGARVVVLAARRRARRARPRVAKGAFLDWQNWDPYDRPTKPVSVDYVWNSNYDGINFPKKPTTVVLRVEGPPTRAYWRATTLDDFTGRSGTGARICSDRSSRSTERDAASTLTDDPLLPEAARDDPRTGREQDVTIEALRDNHLDRRRAAGRVDGDDVGGGRRLPRTAGVARVAGCSDGTSTTRSGATRRAPTPERARAFRAEYPRERRRAVPRGRRPSRVRLFGIRRTRRERSRRALFDDDRLARRRGSLRYEPLYRQRSASRAATRGTPYAAAVALEAWFRETAASSTTSSHRRRSAGRRRSSTSSTRRSAATASTSPARWR